MTTISGRPQESVIKVKEEEEEGCADSDEL
jgi:hypothetical protein